MKSYLAGSSGSVIFLIEAGWSAGEERADLVAAVALKAACI
jgi:hypothetical protein